MSKPLVMLLAGGGGTRLGVLVQHRSKPAVPFAGRYRIIDFALSNVMHAGLDWVGVLTQYMPLSLMSHLGTGEPWNFRGRQRGVRILPPRTGRVASDWYRGTADAIWQSMDFMEPLRPERVLILSGDHIYRMDYRKMLSEHIAQKADLTIAAMEVSPKECSRFGMVWADPSGKIFRFEEKPKETETRLASLGIYLFEWSCLKQALEKIVERKRGFDFGKDVIPALLGDKRIVVHRFDGYWRDVGTVSSFFNTNMDALDAKSGLDLFRWEICTNEDTDLSGDRPPAYFGPDALCEDSLVSAGCRIEGTIVRSVLSPEVSIAKNAIVEDSILMNGVTIGPHAVIRKAILDKGVQVDSRVQIAGGRKEVDNRVYASCDLDGCSLVGKNARIPEGLRIGSNVVVESGVDKNDFPGDVPDGAVVALGRN